MAIKRILVPIDLADPVSPALDFAIRLAQEHAAEVTLLHVVELFYLPAPGDMYGPGSNMERVFREFEHSARDRLTRLAARLKRPAGLRLLVRRGAAHRVIVETAKRLRADLIVMPTHGRTGWAHAILGSVAEKVVRGATCPVLTLPGGRPVRARAHHRSSAEGARPRRRPSAAARSRG
jgi:universal stress protein A